MNLFSKKPSSSGICSRLRGLSSAKGGTAVGTTDEFGYKAVENRKSVNDLHATMLRLLGFNHEKLTYFHNGRHMRLTDVSGEVIPEVVR